MKRTKLVNTQQAVRVIHQVIALIELSKVAPDELVFSVFGLQNELGIHQEEFSETHASAMGVVSAFFVDGHDVYASYQYDGKRKVELQVNLMEGRPALPPSKIVSLMTGDDEIPF